MDHLNIFNAYKKSYNHEDELTRSFLPLVKILFFNW
jgi:hypothetical protein